MSLESLDAVLPASLGVFPGLFLTGRYVLSEGEASHAGNGLKAVPLPDGTIAVAVADTGSRGAPAAMATARLLAVLRGHLESGATLDQALVAVDRYAERSPFGIGATMAVALISPGDGAVEVGSAGHAAPLVLGASGVSRVVSLPPTRPLGLGGSAVVERLVLDHGEALLLHTDGLLTARDGAVLDGAERLRAAIAEAGPLPGPGAAFGDVLSEAVLVAMQRPEGYVDDVALLIAQRSAPPAPFSETAAAQGPSPAEVAALFATWLDGLGVGLIDHVGLSGAVGELAEGLSSADRPRFDLGAELTADGMVEVHLRLAEVWRPETERQRRAVVVAGGLVSSLVLRPHGSGTELLVRQEVGRPVQLLASGRTDRRTGRPLTAAVPQVELEVRATRWGVCFSGAIGADDEERFRAVIHEETWAGTHSTVLDLTEVTRLSGHAVRVLFDYHNRTESSGARVTVVTVAGSAPDQVLTQAAFPHQVAG